MTVPAEAFWGDNYYRHPPLTDDMLKHAEALLQVRLPDEYVALLRRQNGGYTQGLAFPMEEPTSWADDHIPLQELFGIITDEGVETAQNILSSQEMAEEWDLPPDQVLLAGDGHWWITLDYRQGDAPSVAWIDVDSEEDIQVATSFAEFLDGLVPAAQFDEPEDEDDDAED